MASSPQIPRTTENEPDVPPKRARLLRVASFPAGPARIGRRGPSVLQSFNYAFEGVIHVLRTQRNMRIHFAIAAAVLVLALVYDVSKL
jgi:hypothetical protein